MDTVEILQALVAFDTTSHRSNLALVRWMASYLDGHGIEARLIHSDDGAKANLLATIGPDAAGGIVLSGHTDVVPVADQAWESDPFTLVEREGRFHGRGSADMKGFIAACCEVRWEFRPPDEASAVAVKAEVERMLAVLSPGVAVEMALIAGVPALTATNDSAAVAMARSFGARWPPGEVPFGTEAGFFERAGIPSLVCGPGAIAQAHQPNEWIAASELLAADRFLDRVGVWAADGA
jgi:acetylornithine deacetylase/succinyl-diaminopimelate desuccinylase-like protein